MESNRNLTNTEKNHKIEELEKEIAANKIQIAVNEEQIVSLRTDLKDMTSAIVICKSAAVNVVDKFNIFFPDYKVI